jgi:hypothetical protein
MANIVLHVKKEYFDRIRTGEKTEEYRLQSPYWCNRFSDDRGPFENVIIYCGYPPKNDPTRKLVFPFRGMRAKEIVHPLFGDNPVWVFAIDLKQGTGSNLR